MSLRFLIIALLLVQVDALFADSRLEGAWRSDASLTIESIEQVRKLSEKERERFEKVLGNMTMTFTSDVVQVDWGEPGSKPMSVPYVVIETGEQHVTVEFDDQQGGTREKVTYRFEGDCIKRRLIPEGWFEYFCKAQ